MENNANSKSQVASSHNMTLRPKTLPQAEAQPSSKSERPTFKWFKKLPVEIRIMIWKFAEPGRILLLTPPAQSKRAYSVRHLSGRTQVLNFVSHEARSVTQRDYQPFPLATRFPYFNSTPRAAAIQRGHLDFNPDLDIVYARDRGHSQQKRYFLHVLERPKGDIVIKKLAINLHLVLADEPRHIDAFLKLDELTVVVGETNVATRSKVLRLGYEYNLQEPQIGGPKWEGRVYKSGWWGRGTAADQTEQWNILWNLLFQLNEAEKNGDGKMPVVKIMVIYEKDFKPMV